MADSGRQCVGGGGVHKQTGGSAFLSSPQFSASSPIRGGCVGTHTLAVGSLVCIPDASADSSSSGTGQTGRIVPHSSGSGEPLSSVVSRATLTYGATSGVFTEVEVEAEAGKEMTM